MTRHGGKTKTNQPVAGRTVGATAVDAPEEEVAVGDVALAVAPPVLRAAKAPPTTNEFDPSIPQS